MGSSRLGAKGSRIFSVARRLERWLEEHAWSSALIITALFLAATIVLSIRSKMWIDEIVTYYIVHQPSAAEMIRAMKEGADGQPPLYDLIVRALAPVFGNGALGLRLPSAIGVCIMGLSVFAFALRRFPALYAMVAMLLALNSTRYFATQARSYGLVLACAGIALLCWQRVTEPRRRLLALTGLVLSLAGGIALHYFTIYLLFPLAAGELVRWRTSRKLDLPVWAAMGVSVLVLIPHLALIAVHRASSKYFCCYQDPLTSIAEVWSVYFARYSPALLLPAIIFVIWRYPRVSSSTKASVRPGMPVEEWVITGSLVLAPAIIVAISLFTTGMFVSRYAAWTVVGFSVFATAVLFRAVRGDTIAAAIAVTILLGVLGGRTVLNLKRADRLVQAEQANTDLLQLPASTLPIVFSDSHAFLELTLYADAKLSERFVFPVKLESNEARTLLALRGRTPLHVPDYDDFIALNPHFLLVGQSQDRLIWHLNMSGFQVTPLQKHWPPGIFEVTPKATGQR